MRRFLYPLLAVLIAACESTDDGALEGVDPSAADAGLEAAVEADQAASDEPVSAQFTLGTHYRRLSPTQPTSTSPDRVEIAVLFSYREPASYSLEPELGRWRARLPGFVNFVRLPAVRDPAERLYARAYYAAEALGRGAELHDALFRELQGGAPDFRTAAAAVFARFGVSGAEFDTAFDSYDVHANVQRAEELTRRYRVEAVPALVVNGKYTTDPLLAGGTSELFALVDFLAAAERGE